MEVGKIFDFARRERKLPLSHFVTAPLTRGAFYL